MDRLSLVLTLAAAAVASACNSGPRDTEPAPEPRPATRTISTEAAITADDLRLRLTAFAHDSMMGRESGTLGNYKATDYLAAEARRLGLEPGGENGTYFQTIPLVERAVDRSSSVSVAGRELVLWTDYAPIPPMGGSLLPIQVGIRGSLDGAQVVYGGTAGDTETSLAPEQIAGKLVVLDAPRGPGRSSPEAWNRYAAAAGVAIAILERFPPQIVEYMRRPHTVLAGDDAPDGPLTMLVTQEAAERLVGGPLDSASVGDLGATLQGTFRYEDTPVAHPARNVIGILPGSDSEVRGQYIAIGAHTDHDGLASQALSHDSVRAFNSVVRPGGAESRMRQATAEEQARIDATIDSLRALRPARLDSIMNGADDDGSGSVAMLEIAEAFARSGDVPRRSILFVWHTAEEKGLLGADDFTRNPTVPRDSIIAQLNMDMIGRGAATDVENGGPEYLQIIGSRRLSTELGDLVEEVNTRGGFGFEFDYQYDADGHPQMFYCRSDHYMYARYGIPIVFFSTGSHRDYHQVTDEARYIDHQKLESVSRFVRAVADAIAGLDHRVVVDKPKPDPNAPCRQ